MQSYIYFAYLCGRCHTVAERDERRFCHHCSLRFRLGDTLRACLSINNEKLAVVVVGGGIIMGLWIIGERGF